MSKKIKRRTFSIIPLLILGIVVPLAFVDGLAATIAAYTASAITGIFLLTIATASLVFSTFADWFLRITLDPSFINVPYTPGGGDGGNAFVFYGWSIVRNFINMFFILILIVIGLSTSLQVETYRWQKTLPRLVAIALLINFTPVLLGVVIDAANMMMNYFVFSLAAESVFVIRMTGLFDIVASNLADTPWTSFTGAVINPVAMMIIFTLFNLLAGIVYAMYGVIFAMRYVAIWLLVIISPFGFFCYILPATQPFFVKWWRWFIGWCIAGISAAFFLYLGEVMFNPSFIDREAMMPSTTEYQGMDIGMLIEVFPLVIPLLFILFGFFVTISISSLGSKGLLEVFQKASGAAKKSAQLPGSTFKEKSQAAGAAVRGAFSPGPAISSSGSSVLTDSKNKPSFRQGAQGSSLYRRGADATMESGGIKGGRSPISEVASHAGGGAETATKEIASNFNQLAQEGKSESSQKDNKKTPFSSNDSSSKKQNDKKDVCSGCGASSAGKDGVCSLCRKNNFSANE